MILLLLVFVYFFAIRSDLKSKLFLLITKQHTAQLLHYYNSIMCSILDQELITYH